MSGDVLVLESRDLLSKWGFNDGDLPDHVWDYFDTHHGRKFADVHAWDATLRTLVESHLIPALDQKVTVCYVVTHNPVRADTVDGVEVEIDSFADYPDEVLTPDRVEVALAEVARVHREVKAKGVDELGMTR